MSSDAYAFTGEYIHLCARIEHWAHDMIAGQCGAKSVPHTFVQKLDRIRHLAADDGVFANCKTVLSLLEKLQPHVKLRSTLAHAVVHSPTNGKDPILVFEPIGATIHPSDKGRVWVRRSETTLLIAELKVIVGGLCGQRRIDVRASEPNLDAVCPIPIAQASGM